MLKKYGWLLFTFLGVGQWAASQMITRLDKNIVSSATLDNSIKQLMTDAHVQGLAISVFNNNKPVYSKCFGYARIDTKQPIKPTTNIYGASLSKAVFAVLVMKLVEEGKLDLDKPLQSYLPKPIYDYTPVTRWQDHYEDLKNDTNYRKITARMCLDHTTGFPNWRWDEPDQKLRTKAIPGERYSYSGEGMVYLQTVLEKMLGKPLEQLMKENIFTPLSMTHSSYTWQPEFEKDYCFGHKSNGELYEKDKDNEARSASTLETTFEDYTSFIDGVLNYKIITPGTTQLMFTRQVRIRSIAQMGPMRLKDNDANDGIQLGYGLGWGVLQSPYGVGAFKEGHGDGFQHYSIVFPKFGIGIVILSNSDNAEGIFKALLELCIADTFTPWKWENYIPYNFQEK